MIFDSTFFVTLHRELQRGGPGPAHTFLRDHADEVPGMSEITRGEFARGFTSRVAWTEFCDRFVIFPFNDDVAWQASLIFTDLLRRGLPTGENDLWIAATAIAADETLVTRNTKHFQAIRGLRVLNH